jgi:mono/diheme cytochrome c family protein
MRWSLALLASVPLLPLTGPYAAQSSMELPEPRRDYLLNCGGCHGFNGVSNSKVVPNLRDLVGYYLQIPQGRAYLARVPNVAFSTLSDQKLAAVLNYVVFDLGGASAPAAAKAYDAAQVGRWRKQPLTEVSLSQYRQQLVNILITQYHSPAALGAYGTDVP